MGWLLSLIAWLVILKGAIIRRLWLFLRRVELGRAVAKTAQRFERRLAHPDRRLLLAGDSTAVGTGAEDPTRSIAGYFGQDLPNATIVNLGQNGLRTSQLISRLETVRAERFDIAIIIVGGNDVVHFTPLRRVAVDIHRVLTAAKSLAPTVLLLSQGNIGNAPIFPGWLAKLYTIRSRRLRQVFQAAARDLNVLWLDLFHERKSDPWRSRPERYYSQDAFHPSGCGYRDWYEHTRAVLRQADALD